MKNHQAMTLIELIIYMALVVIIIGGIVQFGWNLIIAQAKSDVDRLVKHNLDLISQRISYEVRNASSLNSLTNHSICLSSNNPNYNPLTIYYLNNQVYIGWGGGSNNCTNLTHNVPLSNNQVRVNDLTFTNLSVVNKTTNVNFSLSISYQNLSGRQEYIKTASFSSSSELRSQ